MFGARYVAVLLAVSGHSCSALKVAVLGGSGFVGSRVCKTLVDSGANVISVSASGVAPAWAAGEPWAKSVEWKKNELTRGAREVLVESLGSPDAGAAIERSNYQYTHSSVIDALEQWMLTG